MEHLSSDTEQQQNQEQQMQWRRDKVQETLQQRIQPTGDISNTSSWISYSKQGYVVSKRSSEDQHQKIH
jgi:hypothetical protein